MAQPDAREPHRPANVPECAMACLDALAAAGLGDAVSLVASKMTALVERGALPGCSVWYNGSAINTQVGARRESGRGRSCLAGKVRVDGQAPA